VKAHIKKYGLQSPFRDATTAPPPTSAVAAEVVAPSPAAMAPARRPEPPAPLAPAPPPATPASPTLGVRWTRRRLTLVRARVRSDAPVSLAVTTRVLQTVIERMQSFGGRIESVGPQGLVAVFGLEPDEDAPRRAAHAGLAIVKGFARDDADEGRPPGLS